MFHSDEHHNAILKILNEDYVPGEIMTNKLEKIIGKNFEINKISFFNDEFPVEGTWHNRGLYITVKYEYFYITLVIIDGVFGSNIYPYLPCKN